jgi:hypothetical protein
LDYVEYIFTYQGPCFALFHLAMSKDEYQSHELNISSNFYIGSYHIIEVVFSEPLLELYAVRVESNPVGVATFSGYGTGFQDEEQ